MRTSHLGSTAALAIVGCLFLNGATLADEKPAAIDKVRAARVAAAEKLDALRKERVKENDRGTASEFAGKWKMRLPAGFEYEVQIKQTDAGLLRMTCEHHALLLLGDFACKGGELKLVKTAHERVDDYVWTFSDGRFVLTVDEQGHGGKYLHAVLTRIP